MAAISEVVFAVLFLLTRSFAYGELTNDQVTRKIDVTSQIAKYSTTIVLKNSGSSSENEFVYVVEPQLSEHLSFISAKITDEELKVAEKQSNSEKDGRFFKVALPSALQPGSSVTVNVQTLFTHCILPFPEEISQNDKQLVRFSGNVYYYSSYMTSSQTSTFVLPTSSVESFTRVKPVTTQDANIVYGPYTGMGQMSSKVVTLHFENPSPFLTILSVDRLIEVSHWGNIAVEETLVVKHTGARLKGSFSRYDFQRNPQSGISSVKSYKTLLPAAARDVYYRDEIGNISTSHMREDADAVEVELRPRFPLFGGWQTKYTIGYNLPSYEYLYHSGRQFLLKMRLLDHVFDEQVVDQVNLQVVLPEGAKNIQFKAPFKVEEKPRELLYTYLDTTGRPVVMATASNLVDQHIDEFDLSYQFESYLMFLEPLLVTGAIYLFFLSIVIIVRLDFTISEDESALAKQRVSVSVDVVNSTAEEQLRLVDKVEGVIVSAKQAQRSQLLTNGFRTVCDKWKISQSKLSATHDKVVPDSPETANKVCNWRLCVCP
jgi:oligosaccharyltransferase complex subunit alpha (ribophorin I)